MRDACHDTVPNACLCSIDITVRQPNSLQKNTAKMEEGTGICTYISLCAALF
jgi:hypothetical protein